MSNHILGVLDSYEKGLIDKEEPVKGLEDVYARNITKELLSIKHHFQVVLESMSEGVVEVVDDGRIVFANPVAISLIGVPQEEMLGTFFIRLFKKPDRQRIEEMLNALRSESPPKQSEKLNG